MIIDAAVNNKGC